MESNWRWNVWDMIGNTRAYWRYPIGVTYDNVFLCARLNPDVTYAGKVWTHVLRLRTPGSGQNVALARVNDSENTLDEVFKYYDPAPFPSGFPVLPDHTP